MRCYLFLTCAIAGHNSFLFLIRSVFFLVGISSYSSGNIKPSKDNTSYITFHILSFSFFIPNLKARQTVLSHRLSFLFVGKESASHLTTRFQRKSYSISRRNPAKRLWRERARPRSGWAMPTPRRGDVAQCVAAMPSAPVEASSSLQNKRTNHNWLVLIWSGWRGSNSLSYPKKSSIFQGTHTSILSAFSGRWRQRVLDITKEPTITGWF